MVVSSISAGVRAPAGGLTRQTLQQAIALVAARPCHQPSPPRRPSLPPKDDTFSPVLALLPVGTVNRVCAGEERPVS